MLPVLITREITTLMSPATTTTTEPEPGPSACASSSQYKTVIDQPTTKKARLSLFASYDRQRQDFKPQSISVSSPPVTVATTFVEKMVAIASQTSGIEAWQLACTAEHYDIMKTLLEKIFCMSTSSAPVERVFSYSGIITRPNRAKLSDDMLSALVYLKCNEHL
jgi:hypothetical protein